MMGALSWSEFDHGLEHVNDLPANLLAVLLVKPGSNEQERFKEQPSHDQRTDSAHHNPGICGCAGKRTLLPRPRLLLLGLEQGNHPAHVGKVALQGTRILIVEDRTRQHTPIVPVLSDELEALLEADAA